MLDSEDMTVTMACIRVHSASYGLCRYTGDEKYTHTSCLNIARLCADDRYCPVNLTLMSSVKLK